MNSGTLFAYFVTFTASFCMMVIELVAGRIMAPYIGQHLYSWTSIIGVCLAGISIGAWLGGWLADRFPRRGTLGWFLFFGGVLSMAVPLLTDQICTMRIFDPNSVSLMWRIVVYTTIIFLPSMIFLGMISPMVVKLVVRDLSNAGSIVGRIYSFSTIGSILGTFATGFYLIEEFGTRVLLYVVGAILIVMAPLAGGLFLRAGKYVGGTLAGVILALCIIGFIYPEKYRETRDRFSEVLGQPFYLKPVYIFQDSGSSGTTNYYSKTPFWKESSYYTLRVGTHNDHPDEQTGEMRTVNDLILDNLVHSHSDLDDPSYLAYDYLRIYEELVGWQLKKKGTTKHKELFIGGGGYTLQRYFHHLYKDCHIDVAEIDPTVTYVAETYMGSPKNDPRLVTKNVDGRLFVMEKQKSDDKYDFIFGDAFNDLSIPFHLTTLEFDQQLKNLLTPNGLVMSLVIDQVGQGLFLPSFIATMRKAFGDDNVVLLLIEDIDDRQTIVDYLKKKGLGEYIEALSQDTLEAVIERLDQKKYEKEIAWLKRRALDEHKPYLKPTDLDYIAHSTVIVVGSSTKQDWDDFDKYLAGLTEKYKAEKSSKTVTSRVVRPAKLTEYLNTRMREPSFVQSFFKGTSRQPWTPVILTDDFAPVDNLTAPVFEKKFGYKKQKAASKRQDDEDLIDDLLEDTMKK